MFGRSKNTPPGGAVDASGASVIDPSENVKALNEAGLKHQRELLQMTSKWLRREMHAEMKSLRREAKLTREAQREADSSERSRLDSIRTVDVAAVQRAAEVAAEAVQALAAQVPVQAEAVRTALANTVDPILSNIAELQRAQYELQGAKVGVTDQTNTAAELQAALRPMFEEIKRLSEDRSHREGAQAQQVNTRVVRGANAYLIFGSLGGFFGLVGIVFGIVKLAGG